MNPDLEFFLEDTFRSVEPTSPKIGRVVVEPDYNREISAEDGSRLASELKQCLTDLDEHPIATAAPHGFEIQIPQQFSLLKKYLRQITLHADRAPGPWVEVAPPGNWI